MAAYDIPAAVHRAVLAGTDRIPTPRAQEGEVSIPPQNIPFSPANPYRLLLTPEQRADDASPDPVLEALAVHLYESDQESAFNDGDDVQWRDNYAARDRYRLLARAALEFVHVKATR